VFGLELDDVSFDRSVMTIRPNAWRRLKTRTSQRVVPLWPQLSEILRPYVFGSRLERGGRLLFPAFVQGREQMLTDVRKLLDRLAERAGWMRGEVRTRLFRHTYCAARLQTLDAGARVRSTQWRASSATSPTKWFGACTHTLGLHGTARMWWSIVSPSTSASWANGCVD
jgi:integrase